MDKDHNAEWEARRAAACMRAVGVTTSVYAQRAEGSELHDENGRRYIDFAGGIGVLNVGHRHPRVMAAVKAQLERFTHTCFQVAPYREYITLAERLNRLVPGDFDKRTAFFTTGAEAVENAVKIARAATGRPGLIAFSGAFHGRTMMGLALTGKVHPYKAGFGPLPGEVHRLPFPTDDAAAADSLAALQLLFKTDVDPGQVAAIVIEPVQGEGGFHPVPAGFMRALRAACDEHGILLVADEIQCGFGRTGTLFAMEQFGVSADITTIAKSLAGGMPLSAVTGRATVMDALPPGSLGSTYAGNPLALAAAHAVLDAYDEEDILANGRRLGERLRSWLNAARERHPVIADVRGMGPMLAAELRRADGSPAPQAAQRLREAALERGLVVLVCGGYGNVIRFLFPLNTPDAVFDEALDILGHALAEAGAAA